MGSNTSATETRAVLDAFRYAVQALRESSGVAEKRLGLSGAQLFVLQVLASAGSLSVNELAARTFTHQSSVSVVVSRLVARRLVSRITAIDDGRRRLLAITVSGRRLLRRAPRTAQERLVDGVRRLGPRERGALARSLRTLVSRLDRSTPAPMFFEDKRHAR